MTRPLLVALAWASACGHAAPAPVVAPGPRTPAEIAAASKPAIVRVEAGDLRVGTGFVVDGAGVIATNLHVVAGLAAIRVRLLDGENLPVTAIAGVDADRDLVLLRVQPRAPLPTLVIGDSTRVVAGDPVVAIGNPSGLDYTVSDGLVSSVRVVADDLTLLQISAPISSGSSGGPLFDARGEVIGVTQAVLADGQNLNFAIPSAYVAALLAQPAEVLAPVEFARRTTVAPDDPRPRIVRNVPRHPPSLLDGCTPADGAAATGVLAEAIRLGAPLYNAGNHEACYRIYENAARKLADDSACAGITGALEGGLATAAQAIGFTAQAWAMRDAFDGLFLIIDAVWPPPP